MDPCMAVAALVAGLLWGTAAATPATSQLGGLSTGQANATCPPVLLQLQHRPAVQKLRAATEAVIDDGTEQGAVRNVHAADPEKFSIAGKSIYFLMTDRFARSDGNSTPCNGNQFCNGTLKGVREHLDYIQGMGFDCVWITPVVKQFPGTDPATPLRDAAFHGYWAYDWFDIDPHFGTRQDLRDLSDALHGRGMCLVLDMVVNHVGPLLSSADVANVHPFNETWHYHQYGAKPGMSFDDYTRCYRDLHKVTPECPFPVQAVMSEALGEYDVTVRGDLPYCGVGDYCDGYADEKVLDGWFYDLGDLNQSVPFVRETLLRWASHMVEAYALDAIRLDTAAFVPKDFLAEFQRAVGVEVMGEVTATNQSFHASFQVQRGTTVEDGSPVLDALLNFPLGAVAPYAFCGPVQPEENAGPLSAKADAYPNVYPGANVNLTRLGDAMRQQWESGLYRNTALLGNFVDNHDDTYRIGYMCRGHPSRLLNALVWVMLAKGIPVVYYGTEQGLDGANDVRSSLWQSGFDTSADLYGLLGLMNGVRRRYGLGLANATMVLTSQQRLVFTRGGRYGSWVYLNNLADTDEDVVYRGSAPPPPPVGKIWADVLAGGPSGPPVPVRLGRGRDFVARGSRPKVLVLVKASLAELAAGEPAAESVAMPATS